MIKTMKKFLLTLTIFLLATGTSFAEMMLFVDADCPHCQRLQNHLEDEDLAAKFNIQTYEISSSQENLALYLKTSEQIGYTAGGVPLLVDQTLYVEGADPIADYLAGLGAEKAEIQPTKLSAQDSQQLNQIIAEQVPPEKPNAIPLIAFFATLIVAYLARRSK